MTLTLPNILTILRLLAAPGVAVMFLYFARPYADWYALILFVVAALTDFVDGYLARRWKQETKLGAMLDPIADKVMVVIALMVIAWIYGFRGLVVLPATVILFREVFVSGLREYLGDTAGTLKVTKIAKWKTTVQLVSITVLFSHGLFDHYLGMSYQGMGLEMARDVLAGVIEDEVGLKWKHQAATWSRDIGIALLWLAAILTAISGWDYFQKAKPYLKD